MARKSEPTRTDKDEKGLFTLLKAFFPFLRWFEGITPQRIQLDLISGLTVALVLIPQSMAYAQLADLPAYYGLYAAFIPPVIAAMWGSSHQLATGPVAIVSLMTSTALAPLATAGSDTFIMYAILLALIVGTFQFLLGVLKLGLVVNFLSHPVVNGFTNAAALIIATSQLSKIFGVYVDKQEHHYETVYLVVVEALRSTHLPTLALAILAFATMYILKKINKRIPNVLVAVVITTLISYFIGFEKNVKAGIDKIQSPEVCKTIESYNHEMAILDSLLDRRVEITGAQKEVKKNDKDNIDRILELKHHYTVVNTKINEKKEKTGHERRQIRRFSLAAMRSTSGDTVFVPEDRQISKDQLIADGFRIKVSNKALNTDNLTLMGGGAVVGVIPKGLPKISIPKVDFSIAMDLLMMAVVISLLGFMEAISIAKAMAAKTGQRLDPNQELIGQGLGNIIGSFSMSYPVSGSFSRSAVNIQSGAVTGMSSAFSSLVVMITLLFFTPLLYHLPQAVLAAIIMMAVIGLVNVTGFIHAYQAQKYDGVIAIVSFVGTLGFAPHLDKGIMIGVALSLGHFLFRNIKPDIAILSKYADGTYRNADRRKLHKCRHIAVVRFNNSLFFANINYLEEKILELVSEMKELRHIHLVCNGINELDASGESTLSLLVTRLREKNVGFSLSGINEDVMDVLARTHLIEKIGVDNFYGNVSIAVQDVYSKTHRGSNEERCPLMEVAFKGFEVDPEVIKKMSAKRIEVHERLDPGKDHLEEIHKGKK